jgi:Flp pilus assembly protein TadD
MNKGNNTGWYIGAGIMFALLLEVAGCATVPKRVVRDSQTYTAEVLSSLARETEAKGALLIAADFAIEAGDETACLVYAETALTIEAYAENQAYRALWLAGLPYPTSDGVMPLDLSEEQEDPGMPPAPRDPIDFCGVDNE